MQIQRKFTIRQTVSRNGKCTEAKLGYTVRTPDNLDNREAALELVRQTAPAYLGSARLQNIELVKIPGDGTYEFDVFYRAPEPKEEKSGGERVWSFEIKNSPVRIFEAKELVRIYPTDPKIEPPDPGTRINWDGRMDGDSKINGTLAQVPEMREICVATYRQSRINTAFRRTLFSIAGKLNATVFHGWAPGEVLLESAVQSEPFTNTAGRELVDITYTFAIRPIQTVKISGIEVDAVSMWNTIWSISRRDAFNNASVNCGVYESRIYDYANFSPLDV